LSKKSVELPRNMAAFCSSAAFETVWRQADRQLNKSGHALEQPVLGRYRCACLAAWQLRNGDAETFFCLGGINHAALGDHACQRCSVSRNQRGSSGITL
jgi:hypothetical protein